MNSSSFLGPGSERSLFLTFKVFFLTSSLFLSAEGTMQKTVNSGETTWNAGYVSIYDCISHANARLDCESNKDITNMLGYHMWGSGCSLPQVGLASEQFHCFPGVESNSGIGDDEYSCGVDGLHGACLKRPGQESWSVLGFGLKSGLTMHLCTTKDGGGSR